LHHHYETFASPTVAASRVKQIAHNNRSNKRKRFLKTEQSTDTTRMLPSIASSGGGGGGGGAKASLYKQPQPPPSTLALSTLPTALLPAAAQKLRRRPQVRSDDDIDEFAAWFEETLVAERTRLRRLGERQYRSETGTTGGGGGGDDDAAPPGETTTTTTESSTLTTTTTTTKTIVTKATRESATAAAGAAERGARLGAEQQLRLLTHAFDETVGGLCRFWPIDCAISLCDVACPHPLLSSPAHIHIHSVVPLAVVPCFYVVHCTQISHTGMRFVHYSRASASDGVVPASFVAIADVRRRRRRHVSHPGGHGRRRRRRRHARRRRASIIRAASSPVD
jgi:hypothetical protein